MSKKTIYFTGLLTNVDESILNIRLGHGFKIKVISQKDGIDLLSSLERLPRMEFGRKFLLDLHIMFDKKLYYIDRSFQSELDINNKGILSSHRSGVVYFHHKYVDSYLRPIIRLMRLYKDGNICMPSIYYYYIENIPKVFMSFQRHQYVHHELYSIGSETVNLERFIRDTKLPFKHTFLQLAFETFENSYEISHANLSFLSLMISLEALMNPGYEEISHRVSRNTAVLLGTNREDCEKTYSRIKQLYNKRSKILHVGQLNIVRQEDVHILRNYVRESIKKINKLGLDKKDLLALLNSCGYGQKIKC